MQVPKKITKNKIIVIYGATASGKTMLAEKIRDKLKNAIIINSDALQTYKHINILNASPAENNYNYLYNFLEYNETYSVSKWLEDIINIITKARNELTIPIIVGGTAMYQYCLINGMREVVDISEKIKSATKELISNKGLKYLYDFLCQLDPNTEEILHPNDKNRIIRNYNLYVSQKITPSEYKKRPNNIYFPKDEFIKITLNPDRANLYKIAEERFEQMLKDGAIAEVESLINIGASINDPLAKTIGFKEIYNYLNGDMSLDEAKIIAKQETRNYIKRQYTWINNNHDDKLTHIISKDNEKIIKNLEEILC